MFRNLIIYQLPTQWPMTAATLEQRLAIRPLQPCTAFEMHSRGWVPPGPSGALVESYEGHLLIALAIEEKLLPAAVIKQVAAARAAKIAEEQGYPCGRRQMRELRDKVGDELRARALTYTRTTRAWIDTHHGWLVVDAGSQGRADELVETLRDTLGTLPVRPLETGHSPQAAMAAWLTAGDAPLFTIEQDLELQSLDSSRSTIRYARHALDSREIPTHLAQGKRVVSLGLSWRDRIAFVLTDRLQIKRVEFLALSEPAEQEQSPAEKFAADFALMTGELSALIADVAKALGGEQMILAEAA